MPFLLRFLILFAENGTNEKKTAAMPTPTYMIHTRPPAKGPNGSVAI